MKSRILDLVFFILIAGFLIVLSVFFNDDGSAILPVEEVLEDPLPPRMEYGIEVDTLMVFRDKIGRNQFLSDILTIYGVDYQRIDELARKSKDIFDVRKFRAGNWYTVLTTYDSLAEVVYFVYEVSPVDYVVYALKDSVFIYKGRKDIDYMRRFISGEINTSLWNSFVDNGNDPNIANELSEIFAWTIDFFGIRKGDRYKAVIIEQYVDGEYIGLGHVEAAWFNHMDNDFYALYFVQDSVGDYFDLEGGSMRRTFLKAPLRYRRISSGYSHSRYHPILKIRRPHHGIDYAAAHGTPVHAVGDGVVTSVKWTSQGGRTIHIKHNGTYSTAYLHLSGYGKGIKTGAHVKQGQVIGYVGSTGLATGPHLDFRFYRNGHPVNPLSVKSPPAEPVDSSYLQDYLILRDSLKMVLDSIM